MASNIQNPNLNMKVNVLMRIKLKIITSAITVRLSTEIPNINSTNAQSNNVASSSIKSLIKNAKPEHLCFAFIKNQTAGQIICPAVA